MPLIIKGKTQIISKDDMANKIGQINDEKDKDELSHLPPEVAEKRREILAAKRHREFMGRLQKEKEEALAALKKKDMEVTEELIVEAGPDPIIIKYDDVVTVSSTTTEEIKETPNFDKMTKAEIADWAEENIGLTLDRRKKKAELIETVKNNL